jgi:hypothetical protein
LKEETMVEGLWERSAEENICNETRGSNNRIEKFTKRRTS